MIIQSRLVVSKATHRASLAKITAGDGSHPPLTKPAAEPGVVNVYARWLLASVGSGGRVSRKTKGQPVSTAAGLKDFIIMTDTRWSQVERP